MKQAVILAIRGSQKYADQEPEVIELVTEGWMEYRDIMEVDETDGYEYLVSYEKVSDNLYTTEEILDMTLDAHTTFIAKWESIPDDERRPLQHLADDRPAYVPEVSENHLKDWV